MSDSEGKSLDPRIRRTRQLLQDALVELLKTKSFDEISVQDLVESATLNRGTFYLHYADKYALLESTTASRFQALLDERGVRFDGTCESALGMIFLGVCDYLVAAVESKRKNNPWPLDPHMESAIISVVKKMSLDGLAHQQPWTNPVEPEMVASIVSWGLYGAAKQWILTPSRPPAETILSNIVGLLVPIVHAPASQAPEAVSSLASRV